MVSSCRVFQTRATRPSDTVNAEIKISLGVGISDR
jgi:hypothetical protein